MNDPSNSIRWTTIQKTLTFLWISYALLATVILLVPLLAVPYALYCAVLFLLSNGNSKAYGWARGIALVQCVLALTLVPIVTVSSLLEAGLGGDAPFGTLGLAILLAYALLAVFQYTLLVASPFAAFFGARCPNCGCESVLVGINDRNKFKCGRCLHEFCRSDS